MGWRQGQSYSSDLRVRVLAAVDSGMPARQAALLFQVSVSYIYKAQIRRRKTGESEASTVRGHRPRKLTPEQEQAIGAYIQAQSDTTIAAIQRWLESEYGVRISSGALWLAIDRLGLTFKKNTARQRARKAGRCKPEADLESRTALS
ncbi:transposase [Novispirillum itersonii]|uniref:Transposase n=1 Tax=Novispirillum itersonii TaxID=189 RepID=A0A7W9ZLM6_NOVIT|nr:transposase [Novispirillum itersonii]